jgi:branched-chain amino acid transport system substrate-binding protein
MKTILFLKLLVVTGIVLIGSLAFSSDKKTAEAKTTGSQPAVAQVSSDQPTASTAGEAKKKELYGNVPEDLEPFGTFVEKPYHRYFVASDAAITFWGPGREKPDPDVPTVKIGLLAPLERTHETYMGISIKRGSELAIAEANAQGGYKGKPFELVARNDNGLWGASANEIVTFTYDDKVWAVIGTVDGANTHIAIRVALRTDMPIMNIADLDPTLMETNIPWVFRVIPDDRQMAYTIAYYVYKQLGLGKVAILRANNRYGRFGVARFRKGSIRLGKAAPVEINYEINYEKVNMDFTAQMERLLKAEPDGVILWADCEPAAYLVKKMREVGLKIPIVACERVVRPEFLKIAGPAAEGVVATYPYNPDSDNPRLGVFKEKFQERYCEPPDAYAAHAYDGTQLVIEAIKKAGLNRYKIRDELEATRHWQGITGEINMDDVYTNRRPVTVATVKDGKFVFGIPKLDRVF